MKWLANLLINKRALQILLDFLKSKKVVNREKEAEKDKE